MPGWPILVSRVWTSFVGRVHPNALRTPATKIWNKVCQRKANDSKVSTTQTHRERERERIEINGQRIPSNKFAFFGLMCWKLERVTKHHIVVLLNKLQLNQRGAERISSAQMFSDFGTSLNTPCSYGGEILDVANGAQNAAYATLFLFLVDMTEKPVLCSAPMPSVQGCHPGATRGAAQCARKWGTQTDSEKGFSGTAEVGSGRIAKPAITTGIGESESESKTHVTCVLDVLHVKEYKNRT